MTISHFFQDTFQRHSLFRRRVTIATAVCLAACYGMLACFDHQEAGGVHFHWRWSALLWAMVGEGSATFFWHKIWPPPKYPAATRKGAIIGTIIFILPALWWLAPPLRFLIRRHFGDAAAALVVVAMAVSCGVWLITRLIKAFQSSDEFDLNALKSDGQKADTDSIAE
jgi:hypothetical protein